MKVVRGIMFRNMMAQDAVVSRSPQKYMLIGTAYLYDIQVGSEINMSDVQIDDASKILSFQYRQRHHESVKVCLNTIFVAFQKFLYWNKLEQKLTGDDFNL